jgi:GT2 family glycosyltransferase
MPEPDPTVAIPTRDGGKLLERTLARLAAQTVEHELLVCDSGSTDDSVAGRPRARRARARDRARRSSATAARATC